MGMELGRGARYWKMKKAEDKVEQKKSKRAGLGYP